MKKQRFLQRFSRFSFETCSCMRQTPYTWCTTLSKLAFCSHFVRNLQKTLKGFCKNDKICKNPKDFQCFYMFSRICNYCKKPLFSQGKLSISMKSMQILQKKLTFFLQISEKRYVAKKHNFCFTCKKQWFWKVFWRVSSQALSWIRQTPYMWLIFLPKLIFKPQIWRNLEKNLKVFLQKS